jgi:hypothetical protein
LGALDTPPASGGLCSDPSLIVATQGPAINHWPMHKPPITWVDAIHAALGNDYNYLYIGAGDWYQVILWACPTQSKLSADDESGLLRAIGHNAGINWQGTPAELDALCPVCDLPSNETRWFYLSCSGGAGGAPPPVIPPVKQPTKPPPTPPPTPPPATTCEDATNVRICDFPCDVGILPAYLAADCSADLRAEAAAWIGEAQETVDAAESLSDLVDVITAMFPPIDDLTPSEQGSGG